MFFPVLLFIAGLLLLIKGGDWFVDSATDIAHRFHLPEILIGATIVSIGTTLPEVMVSANSALSGHGDIAYGNAVGSVICNTALIAALTVAIRPQPIDRSSLKTPALFFFGSAAIYLIMAYGFGSFSRPAGAILVAIFIFYIGLSIKQGYRDLKLSGKSSGEGTPEEEDDDDTPLGKSLLGLVVGAACIAVGADLLVDNGTLIAVGLGVPESVVALTFVALGTSLPELVTAITALAKGHAALSLGNIIGANLFNIVLVCGVSALLSPFAVPANSYLFGINSSMLVDLPLMILVMLILNIPALRKGRLYRAQGIILLMIYAAFVVYQFTL